MGDVIGADEVDTLVFDVLGTVVDEACGCRLFIRAGQEAFWYSWRMPLSRSRLRTSRCAICSGSVIGSGSGRRGCGSPEGPVGPVLVVEVLELPQRMQEGMLIPDERAVQQLVTACLHPSFHDRIHPRHLDSAEHCLDTRVLEDGVEQAGELAVAVRSRNRARLPAFSRSMTRFLAAWTTQ